VLSQAAELIGKPNANAFTLRQLRAWQSEKVKGGAAHERVIFGFEKAIAG